MCTRLHPLCTRLHSSSSLAKLAATPSSPTRLSNLLTSESEDDHPNFFTLPQSPSSPVYRPSSLSPPPTEYSLEYPSRPSTPLSTSTETAEDIPLSFRIRPNYPFQNPHHHRNSQTGFVEERINSLQDLVNEIFEDLRGIEERIRDLIHLIHTQRTLRYQDVSTQTEQVSPPTTPQVNLPSRVPETHRNVNVVHHQIDDYLDRELSSNTIYASSIRLYFNQNSRIHRIDVRERIQTRIQTSDT